MGLKKIDNLDSISNIKCMCVVQYHKGTKAIIEKIAESGKINLLIDCKGQLEIKSNNKTRIIQI